MTGLKEILNKLKNHTNVFLSESKESLDSDEKKPVNKFVVWAIIIAILVLFSTSFFGGNDSKNKNNKEITTSSTNESTNYLSNEYVLSMENDLKEILEKINGSGNVSVRIYIDSTNEKILAENNKQQGDVSEDEKGKTESSSSESTTVMSSGGSGYGSSGSPYVVREKLPYPIGVVVVADGASDKRVQNEMYEAVKALYGLSANRIKITY